MYDLTEFLSEHNAATQDNIGEAVEVKLKAHPEILIRKQTSREVLDALKKHVRSDHTIILNLEETEADNQATISAIAEVIPSCKIVCENKDQFKLMEEQLKSRRSKDSNFNVVLSDKRNVADNERQRTSEDEEIAYLVHEDELLQAGDEEESPQAYEAARDHEGDASLSHYQYHLGGSPHEPHPSSPQQEESQFSSTAEDIGSAAQAAAPQVQIGETIDINRIVKENNIKTLDDWLDWKSQHVKPGSTLKITPKTNLKVIRWITENDLPANVTLWFDVLGTTEGKAKGDTAKLNFLCGNLARLGVALKFNCGIHRRDYVLDKVRALPEGTTFAPILTSTDVTEMAGALAAIPEGVTLRLDENGVIDAEVIQIVKKISSGRTILCHDGQYALVMEELTKRQESTQGAFKFTLLSKTGASFTKSNHNLGQEDQTPNLPKSQPSGVTPSMVASLQHTSSSHKTSSPPVSSSSSQPSVQTGQNPDILDIDKILATSETQIINYSNLIKPYHTVMVTEKTNLNEIESILANLPKGATLWFYDDKGSKAWKTAKCGMLPYIFEKIPEGSIVKMDWSLSRTDFLQELVKKLVPGSILSLSFDSPHRKGIPQIISKIRPGVILKLDKKAVPNNFIGQIANSIPGGSAIICEDDKQFARMGNALNLRTYQNEQFTFKLYRSLSELNSTSTDAYAPIAPASGFGYDAEGDMHMDYSPEGVNEGAGPAGDAEVAHDEMLMTVSPPRAEKPLSTTAKGSGDVPTKRAKFKQTQLLGWMGSLIPLPPPSPNPDSEPEFDQESPENTSSSNTDRLFSAGIRKHPNPSGDVGDEQRKRRPKSPKG